MPGRSIELGRELDIHSWRICSPVMHSQVLMRTMNPCAPEKIWLFIQFRNTLAHLLRITVSVCRVLQPTSVLKQSDQQDIRSVSWMEVFNPHHLCSVTAVQLWTEKWCCVRISGCWEKSSIFTCLPYHCDFFPGHHFWLFCPSLGLVKTK